MGKAHVTFLAALALASPERNRRQGKTEGTMVDRTVATVPFVSRERLIGG